MTDGVVGLRDVTDGLGLLLSTQSFAARALIGSLVAAALAAASIGVAAPAHALPQIDDPDPRTPFDFSGQVIELPFGLRVKFVDTDWEPGFQGVNAPRGGDISGPRAHGNPSG